MMDTEDIAAQILKSMQGNGKDINLVDIVDKNLRQDEIIRKEKRREIAKRSQHKHIKRISTEENKYYRNIWFTADHLSYINQKMIDEEKTRSIVLEEIIEFYIENKKK